MATRSKKIRAPKVDRIARRSGVPDAQVEKGGFVVRDIVNHSDEDQRAMVRSGAKDKAALDQSRQTVRRLTRIERLVQMKILDRDQAAACQWYADAHELGFVASLGCTANYGGAGGGGSTSFDLLARYKAQQEARDDYAYAKMAIPADLVSLFESVILGQLGENEFRAVTRNEHLRIGIAALRLHGQVAHLIATAA